MEVCICADRAGAGTVIVSTVATTFSGIFSGKEGLIALFHPLKTKQHPRATSFGMKQFSLRALEPEATAARDCSWR
jgi:hypothetical protein